MSAPKLPVALTAAARRDYRSILLSSLRQWGPEQRDAYDADLTRAIALLAHNPAAGRFRSDLPIECRSFPVRQHPIIYRFDARAVRCYESSRRATSPDCLGREPSRRRT